jgi:hypothetical protein
VTSPVPPSFAVLLRSRVGGMKRDLSAGEDGKKFIVNNRSIVCSLSTTIGGEVAPPYLISAFLSVSLSLSCLIIGRRGSELGRWRSRRVPTRTRLASLTVRRILTAQGSILFFEKQTYGNLLISFSLRGLWLCEQRSDSLEFFCSLLLSLEQSES